MKKQMIILLTGIMLVMSACGTGQSPEASADTAEETTLEAAAADESASDEADDESAEENVEYVEDTVLSTDILTLTIPDEFKGKFLAIISDDEISIYDKECYEDGFAGFVFSVIANRDNEVVAGGLYTKVGEVTAADGTVYDVCMSYPSDMQWDYTKYDGAPENYAKLSEASTSIVESAKGNNGATFKYGAGLKGEELYPEIIKKYTDAFKAGWDADKLEEAGMSPEFYALAQAEGDKAFEKIGYAYRDISNDGVDELMVGIIGDGNEPSTVYDVYTVVNREPVPVTSGTARNFYYAMEYGGLTNVFFSGAEENGIRVYIIEGCTANLFFQYGVKYDAYTDEKNPWFKSMGSGGEEDEWEPITEEDYKMWVDRAEGRYLKLDYTPFSTLMVKN